MADRRRRGLPTSAVLVSVLLWSTAYGLSALVLVTASPAVLSELRVSLAVPLLIALIVVRGSPRRGLSDLASALTQPATAVLALTGVALFYLPSSLGLALSSPGTAAVMSASLPVLTALLAWWLIRERPTQRVASGLVLATIGIVIGSTQVDEMGWGSLLLVAGLLSYALYTVLLRRRGAASPNRHMGAGDPAGGVRDALVLATATAIWGSVLMLPWLAWELVSGGASWPSGTTGWLSILFLSLVVTAPTMALYNYGAERVPAALSGVAASAVPALAYGFAVLLGESLEIAKVAGGALALTGIVIAAVPSARASDASTGTIAASAARQRHQARGLPAQEAPEGAG